MPTSKSRAEYMAARRAAQKKDAEDAAKAKDIVKDLAPAFEAARKERDIVTRRGKVMTDADIEALHDRIDGDDRKNGLPRSNYSQDMSKAIAGMTQHQRDAILGHPAIKTAAREKK